MYSLSEGGQRWVVLCLLAAASGSADALDLSSSPADLQLIELLWTRFRTSSPHTRGSTGRGRDHTLGGLPEPRLRLPVGNAGPRSHQPAGARQAPAVRARQARAAAVFDTVELLRQRWFDLWSASPRSPTASPTSSSSARSGGHRRSRRGPRRPRCGEVPLQSRQEHERLSAPLLLCAQAVGLPCRPFGSPDAARAFLSARLAQRPPAAKLVAQTDLTQIGWMSDLTTHLWLT